MTPGHGRFILLRKMLVGTHTEQASSAPWLTMRYLPARERVITPSFPSPLIARDLLSGRNPKVPRGMCVASRAVRSDGFPVQRGGPTDASRTPPSLARLRW